MQNLKKIRPVEPELFRAEGQTQTDSRWTDMTKLIVACNNFENALEKER